MKTVCSILITVLILHLQCNGSCLAESLNSMTHAAAAAGEPPCHKHSDLPTQNPQAPHEDANTCSQGPVIESKTAGSAKDVLPLTAALPAAAPAITLAERSVSRVIVENPSRVWSPSIPISILRI